MKKLGRRNRKICVLLGLLTLPALIFVVLLIGIAWEIVTIASASDYILLSVPIKSWFVLNLGGLFLFFAVTAFYVWHQLHKVTQDVVDLQERAFSPVQGTVPVVYGHKHVDRPEFLALIQALFKKAVAGGRYVEVSALPGGYGGGTTLLARARRRRNEAPLSRAFVVKLGDREEMAGEEKRFLDYVQHDLIRGAEVLDFAEWEGLAGIAYEFVGVDPDHEFQSFHQFYEGYATVEIGNLIRSVYSQLRRSWYRKGETVLTDLYQEYDLLHKKREQIIKDLDEIVDQDDGYRRNFTVGEEKLQSGLRPAFCPEIDIRWHDPVAFLRTWPGQTLRMPVHRAVIHGDLHARNILIEIAEDGQKHPWFIDFSHTGNGLSEARTTEALQASQPIDEKRGATLRDFSRLEADVKFILTPLHGEDDLRLAVAFEKELLARGLQPDKLPATPPAIEPLVDERFRKAWHVIREIRLQAARYVVNGGNLRPYAMSLLHATLPIVYYHPDQFANEISERQQKRYALIAAGMLCARI